MEWVACVGMDWGDQEHAYAIRTPDGASGEGKIGSSSEELHDWARGLRERFGSGTIVVALEEGRGSVMYALMEYDFIALVPINPRASKSYRDSLRLSGASSDRSDAALICEFVVGHLNKLRVWHPDDEQTRKLRLLTETRRLLVDQRTARTHALAEALKQYFPQALQWFGGESSPLLRAILRVWPTLEQLREVTVEELVEVLRALRRRKISAVAKQVIERLRVAVPLTHDRAILEARSMYVQTLIALIEPLETEIDRYDDAIAAAWQRHPDREIFDSLPGAGPVLAPRLAAAFGLDRTRYEDADQMQCYSGIAPVIEESGNQRWVHARWGFPKFLHQTFHEFAKASIPHSAWAKAVYQEQRDRGAGHHEAIRALAFRWIRILFRLWKSRLTYDEQKHVDALVKNHSPIARRLAA